MSSKYSVDIAEGLGERKYVKLIGELSIRHVRGDEVIDEQVIKNLVVSAGKAGVASRINGDGAEAVFTHLAIGTGTTAPAAGDTALQAEITTGGGARAAGTASRVTTTVTNDTAQLVHQWTFTASFAVTEAGILNAASAGTLLARQTFSAINVVSGDKLEITWKVQVT
jgi:hypothetical protein